MKIKKDEALKAARHELIRRGEFDWLMHEGQRELAGFFEKGTSTITVFNCPRRFGKSYFMVLLAIKYAYKKANSQIRVAAPTAKQIRSIFVPLINQILSHFPNDRMPLHANNTWTFSNGSKIILAGADYKEGDALRGVASDLILVDEAGFTKNLRYLVQDILLPQTLTTGGRVILASTPPKSIDHPFSREYIPRAVSENAYIKKTIYDNPLISQSTLNKYIEECGGTETDTFKREYLCELISDTSALIIPEFKLDQHVKKDPVPPYYKAYVGCDFGLKDFTAIIFGYFDFTRQVLVIQDEYIANYKTTEEIGKAIKEREAQLWKPGQEVERLGDNELQILWDLHRTHGISIKPAMKYDKEAAIAAVRDQFSRGGIEVWPNCKNLIHQLLSGIWNTKRTTFERSESVGHCDAIDALVYLNRHIRRRDNPNPAAKFSHHTHYIPPKPKGDHSEWGKVFKIKGKA